MTTLAEALRITWGIGQLERLKPQPEQSAAITHALRITADVLIAVSQQGTKKP